MSADRISKDGRGYSRITRVVRAASGHCTAAVGVNFGIFTPRCAGVALHRSMREHAPRKTIGTSPAQWRLQMCFGLCRATCVQRSDPMLPVVHAGGCAAGRRRPGGARRQRARQQPAGGHVAAAAGYVDAVHVAGSSTVTSTMDFPQRQQPIDGMCTYLPLRLRRRIVNGSSCVRGLPSLGLQQHWYVCGPSRLQVALLACMVVVDTSCSVLRCLKEVAAAVQQFLNLLLWSMCSWRQKPGWSCPMAATPWPFAAAVHDK